MAGFMRKKNPIGVDHSLSGLKWAQRQARLPVIQAKMEALPFKPGVFGGVVCSLSFQYLRPEELKKCLKEVWEVLKIRGGLALSYPNVKKKPATAAEHAALPQEELKQVLEDSGFRIQASRGVCFRNPRFLVNWSVRPALKHVSRFFYRISRIGRIFPKQAYHYVLCCEKSSGPALEKSG